MVTAAAALTPAACTKFGADLSPSNDAMATDPLADAAGPADATLAAPSVAVANLKQPTVLLRDGDALYIGAADGVHRWSSDAGAAVRLTSAGPVRGLARSDVGLMIHAADKLSFFGPGADADAGLVDTPCAAIASVQAVAVFAGEVFYGTPSELRTTYGVLECGNFSEPVAKTLATSVLFADTSALYRYQPGTGGSIEACTKAKDCGGSSTTLQSNLAGVTAMVVDETYVYWATATSVFSAPKLGGAPVTLATDQGSPRALTTGAGAVFWTNYEGGTVMRAEVSAPGAPRVLQRSLDKPWGIALALDGSEVFVAESAKNQIIRFSLR